MNEHDFQLEMNFSAGQNRFRKNLHDGVFTLLIESAVPGAQMPPEEATVRLQELEKAVLEIKDINCGLAVLDRNENQEAWSGIEFASRLSEENRDRHVVYLSGAGKNIDDVRKQLSIAKNAGCVNIVPVSGDLDGQMVRTGSGEILAELLKDPVFSAGVTVNPFQYDAWAMMAQYHKLASRLHHDTGFFVTQAGWDTLKMQSLSWYLLNRNIYVPGFARLVLLSPDRMEQLLAGKQPGVIIPDELRKTLEKELCYSRAQFDAAQLRRLELQAAACRLMGFNGIQLAGADTPSKAVIAAARVVHALREFSNFEEYMECYRFEMAESELNSFNLEFQLFDRVFHRAYSFDDPPVSRELPAPRVGIWERVFNACSPGDDFSRERQGVATCRKCPKHLAHGPCGGVRPDGRCENGSTECVYRKWIRFAAANDKLASVEKEMGKY